MVRTGSWIAFGLLAAFALGGEAILGTLGISMASFRLAGGLLLLIVGFRILRAEDSPPPGSSEGEFEASQADLAITPLAIPMIASPASISAAILRAGCSVRPSQYVFLLLAIGCSVAITYYVLLLASRGLGCLKQVFVKLLFRLSGLVLIALAAQFMLAGLEQMGILANLGPR